MKANAPEKIYLYPSIFKNGKILGRWFKTRYNQDSIEYTRTETFIKEVCDWLKDCATITYMNGEKQIDKEMYKATVEDFKNYMKGE